MWLELSKGILDSGSVICHCAMDQLHSLLQETVKTTIGYDPNTMETQAEAEDCYWF